MIKGQIKIFPDKTIGSEAENNRIEQSSAYNFVEFSQIHEYRKVNRDLLETALKFLPKNIKQITHVDNATGTGLVPQLAAELYHERGIKATIFGIDPDLYALKKAAESMRDIDYIHLLLFQGYGQNLEELLKNNIPDDGVDVVSIHDAIHEIPGREIKRAIFASQAKILKPGGVQTYNSSFTTIGNGDAALKWGRWKMDSFAYFKEKRNKEITAMEVCSPAEYKEMILSSGLKIIHEKVNTVVLSLEALKAISRYPEYVNGIFRDMENTEKYSLLEKSKVLIAILKKEGVTSLPRQWHEIVAQKPV
jgi:ubiquinone/menaquinone biosynthesis C-methylase UbiE